MSKDPYKGKTTWQKVWYFLWEDDSMLSWVVNVVIAFILIKYMLYPGLGMLFGTTHPVVAVVSGSMEHKTTPACIRYLDETQQICIDYSEDSWKLCNQVYDEKQRVDFDLFWEACGDFYREFNINKNEFASFPLSNGFNTGDIIVLFGREPEDIQTGDVIVFAANQPDPIIHRVIDKWENDGDIHFQTKGDHNPSTITHPRVREDDIHEDRVVGKAVFRIPYLGYIKIWFVRLLEIFGLNSSIGRLFN